MKALRVCAAQRLSGRGGAYGAEREGGCIVVEPSTGARSQDLRTPWRQTRRIEPRPLSERTTAGISYRSRLVCSGLTAGSSLVLPVLLSIPLCSATIVFYAGLFHSVLIRSVLNYSVLNHSFIFHYVLFDSVPLYSGSLGFILFYSILFYSILFYFILLCFILFYSTVFIRFDFILF